MPVELPLHIREHIDTFTGRTWLLPKLQTWLSERNERVFLITGLPGAGKSMLAAWLAGSGPIPTDQAAAAQLAQLRATIRGVHFCISGASVALQDVIGGLARRLTETLPGFGRALLASSSREVQITINQHAENVSGSITGVAVERLVLGDMTPERALSLLLVDPLHQLYPADSDTQVVLLVDALDEAETASAGPKVAQLLVGLRRRPDLPRQVRILVTTRPDPRVLTYFKPLPCESKLDLIDDAPVKANDIAQYAQERLAGLDADCRTALTQKVAAAAKGIFLYAHLVLEGLRAHPPARAEIETLELPRDLSDLYLQFLLREIGAEERWYTTYYPVLGLIAVAQGEGLSRVQIQSILGKPRPEVEPALRACAQYLVGSVPDGPFRPFHQSFTEFLLEDVHNTDRHIDAAEMHSRIADYYLRTYATDWLNCPDRYALQYTPGHLIVAASVQGDLTRCAQRTLTRQLNELLTDFDFWEAKAGTLGVDLLQSDLRAGLRLEPLDSHMASTLQVLLRILDREAVNLHHWQPAQQPILFDQQLYVRALRMQVAPLAAQLELRLGKLGQPYLQRRWSTERGGPELERTLVGHTHAVHAVAATRNGRWLVSASISSALKVWELETGREVHVLSPETRYLSDSLIALMLTPDSRHVMAMVWVNDSEDGEVKMWDLETGQEVRTIHHLRHWYWTSRNTRRMAVLPDGQHVIAWLRQRFELHHLDDWWHDRPALGDPGEAVSAAALTPDGNHLVYSTNDGIMKVWELETAQSVHTFGGDTAPVRAIAITPNGDWVASVDTEHTLKVWNFRTRGEQWVLHGYTSVTPVVTPDGRKAIALGDENTLHVWNLQKGEIELTLRGHTDTINDFTLSPDGTRVISASSDHTLKIWDIAVDAIQLSAPVERAYTGHVGRVTALAVTPDGKRAISGSGDGLKVWDIQTGYVAHTIGQEDGWVDDVVITPNGRRVVAVTSRGRGTLNVSTDGSPSNYTWSGVRTVKVYEVETWQDAYSIPITYLDSDETEPSHEDLPDGSAPFQNPAPDLSLVISGDGSNAILFTQAPNGFHLTHWNLHTKEKRGLSFSSLHSLRLRAVTPDSRYLIFTFDEHELAVCDLQTGELVRTFSSHRAKVYEVAVTPDGKKILSASEDGEVRVWNAETDDEFLFLLADHFIVKAITGDGCYAFLALRDGTLRLQPLQMDRVAHRLVGHTDRVNAVAITTDGCRAVSAADDRTLKLWDVNTGQQLASVALDHPMRCVAFTLDGTTVVAGDELGQIYCFNIMLLNSST
jgi:WD40 repeat protein